MYPDSYFLFGGYFTRGLVSIVWIAFVIWMIVDCVRSAAGVYWIFLILIFQPFGAIMYFAIHVVPTLEAGRFWDRLWAGQRRIRELKAQIHNMDRPYHWTKLGDEYRARRNGAEAARCYEAALERELENEEARFGLGMVRLEQGEYAQTLDLLTPLAGENVAYEYGAATLAIARAHHRLGQADRALAAYDALLSRYTYSEAQYEYAVLLHEQGQQDKALGIMRRIVEDARNATGFNRARERRWGWRANRFLKLRGH